ncbi:MAG: hypothetical protein IKE22_09360, partial [Atopobiaceae bacterium]|nr:hypothetical protein [Atopobiaceae bacterium]
MHNLPRTSVSLLLSAALLLSSFPITALAEPEEPDGAESDVVLVEEVPDGSGDLTGDEGDPEGGNAGGTTTDGATDGEDNPGTTTDEGTDVLEGDPSDADEGALDD